jgi:protein-S-isoprenylcysteine O-methyltransferase Ste14
MRRPKSAVPLADGLAGLASLTVAAVVIAALHMPPFLGAICLLMAAALPMLYCELARGRRKPGPRPRARPAAWLLGLVVAWAPFLAVQIAAIRPELLVIGWLVAAPALAWRMCMERVTPFSGFPAMLGQAMITRQWQLFSVEEARLWALKAFFLPLYGLSLFALVAMLQAPSFLFSIVVFCYSIDLAFALAGYAFASKLTVVSMQPRVLGWVVCLACYIPFAHHWPAFERVIYREVSWPALALQGPMLVVGATLMCMLLLLYVSATVAFGLRFANLANRGIITSGPYRLMKHPAYFAHAANAWVIAFLLLPAAGFPVTFELALVPIAFTILYRLRSVTEEQHLSEAQEYRDYCDWIAEHGLVGRIRSLAKPWLVWRTS